MMKFSIKNGLLCVSLFLSACGPLQEKISEDHLATSDSRYLDPGQDALFKYADDQWPVSCYFYDPKSKDFGQNLPLWNQAWEWAKTDDDLHIHVTGQLEGGFLVAKEAGYSEFDFFNRKPALPLLQIKTTNDLENLCQKSIDRKHPQKGYKLIGMVGSKDTMITSNIFGDNAHPIVFGEDNSKNRITRLVAFGDSLTDTGRLKKWIQVMPERPFFLGRFSNGGTWSDFLSRMADIGVLNYSTGGAVTKPNISRSIKEIMTYVKELGRYYITGSLANFVNEYRKNEIKQGPIPAPEKTLFVLWGGANDFLSRFDTKADINNLVDKAYTPGIGGYAIARQIADNMKKEAQDLIDDGAQNILIVNLPDIGATPRMSESSGFAKGNYVFSEEMTKIIKAYNEMLAAEVADLQQNNPDKKIILFDAFAALNHLMEGLGPDGKPFDYGINMDASFTTITSPDKPDIRIGKKCYLGSYLGSTKDSDICTNASEMLFFDEVHPTAMGHCGLAFLLHQQLHQEGLVEKADWSEYREVCKGIKG